MQVPPLSIDELNIYIRIFYILEKEAAKVKRQKAEAGNSPLSTLGQSYIRIYILLEKEAAKLKKQALESKQEMQKELKKLKEDNKKEVVKKEAKRESRRRASLSPGSDTSEVTQSSATWRVQGFPLLPIPRYRTDISCSTYQVRGHLHRSRTISRRIV